ncbi:MFS transporter [Paenibacillus sp. LMG 31460]|uniref:MFS transporter n=1 Tax=Paenibacillus germinis TaxID=2654979 RepID=A0ABX1ZHC4_9BACL|nr:MFS transporter [Paenibacillus germinis]NOU91325.1 MFS transporter [Paenibacillus germinis]
MIREQTKENAHLKPIIILALITAVSLFGDSMLYVVLPIHWNDVGLTSLIEVGILLSANRFVRLPLGPLIGWLYNKISIRNGVFLAVFIAGMTTLLYGWVDGLYSWLVLRCTWGVAWSLLRLGSYFMILELSDDQNRGYFMGTYNGLYRIGSLVGMLAGSICVELFGLRAVATTFGVLAFLVLPAVYKFVPRAKKQIKSEGVPLQKRMLIKLPALQETLISVFLVGMCLDGMLTATLSHLIDVHHKKSFMFYEIVIGAATLAGTLQAVRWGLGLFMSPWFGRLSDQKWGRRPLFIGSLALASIFMAATNFEVPFAFWLLDLLALLIITTLLSTIMDAMVSDIAFGSSRTFIMTMYVVVSDVGASMGPLFGYFSEHFIGLTMTYWLSATLLLLLSIIWFMKGNVGMRRNSSVNQ